MCSHFVLISGILYKRGFGGVFLRCINHPETSTILEQARRVCDRHFGVHATYSKVLLRRVTTRLAHLVLRHSQLIKTSSLY